MKILFELDAHATFFSSEVRSRAIRPRYRVYDMQFNNMYLTIISVHTQVYVSVK